MLISEYLRRHRVHFDLLLHRPASCASRLAGTLHVPGRQVAKSVLIRGERGGFLLAVLPATHRIDLELLETALNLGGPQLASEPELDAVFRGCEYGALPPFGRCFGIPTVVDATLAGSAEILAESDLRHQVVRLRYRDYEAVEEPTRARFAAPIEACRRPRRRRAS